MTETAATAPAPRRREPGGRQAIIEAAARRLGHTEGAIRHWRHDRRVAHSARLGIARLVGDTLGVELTDGDFEAVAPTGRPVPPALRIAGGA